MPVRKATCVPGSGRPLPRRIASEAAVLFLALAVPSCTHDFSEFDLSGEPTSSGGASSNGGASSDGGSDGGGAAGDASVASGGGQATGGASASGGTGGVGEAGSGGGGAAGGSGGTGGASGTGAAGGGAGTGGGVATGGAPSTGGVPASGGTPGTGGGTDAGAACTAIFGAAPQYKLCGETATTCRFSYTASTRETCQAICSTYGGACVSADNTDPLSCTSVGAVSCTAALTDAACVCSKP